MKLKLGDEVVVEAPDAAAIESGLRSLVGADEPYAVIESHDELWLQMLVDSVDACHFEACDGGLDEHYVAQRAPPLDEVITVFQDFATGGNAYKDLVYGEDASTTPREALAPAAPSPSDGQSAGKGGIAGVAVVALAIIAFAVLKVVGVL